MFEEPFDLDQYLDPSIYPGPDRLQEQENIANQVTNSESTPKNFSISKIFYPGANICPRVQDFVLVSDDSVLFQVSSSLLLEASVNRFGSLIPSSKVQCVGLPDTASVLNILLHSLYNISFQDSPSLEASIAAANRFPFYGISPRAYIVPLKPLYKIFLSYAPIFPLDVYALAASLDLYDLAAAASSYLLSFSIATISDEMAERIGSVYLNRLVHLHAARMQALKALVLAQPHPHPESISCSFAEQRKLIHAWTMVAAPLAWEATPDLSSKVIESNFGALENQLSCTECKKRLREHIRHIVVQWTLMRRTI